MTSTLVKTISLIIITLFIISLAFTAVSQYVFHLPYGWNIDATNSMYPLIPPGSIVFVVPLFGNPQLNEIVAYRAPLGCIVIHEIIGVKQGEGYITKGINNPLPDPWIVKRSWIYGFVPTIFGYPLEIPYAGYALYFISRSISHTDLIIGGVVLIVGSLFLGNSQAVVTQRKRRGLGGGGISLLIPPFKKIALIFFIVAFLILFLIFAVYSRVYALSWYSSPSLMVFSHDYPFLSFYLGSLPSNTYINFSYTSYHESKYVYLLVVLLSNTNSVKIVKTNEGYILSVFTGSKGLHSYKVSITPVLSIVPYNIAVMLDRVNPLLLPAIQTMGISLLILGVMSLIYFVAQRLSEV
ncbi:MAG: signal peptidase I [Sulfolobaceae archaeon]|nr:signal peptidase I [Sulfolobaceae archaeon]